MGIEPTDRSPRTVVEGENPYRLAPGAQAEEEPASSDSDDDETGASAGSVYRITKGQLRRLEGGMEQYEEIAARTAAKLGKGTVK